MEASQSSQTRERVRYLREMQNDFMYKYRVDKGIMKTFFKQELSEGFKKFLKKFNLQF